MYFGQPFGAFGDPEKHIEDLQVESTASGIRVRILASSGIGNAYYQVYVNNILASVFFCPEGDYSEWVDIIVPPANDYQITAFRIGANSTLDQTIHAQIYDTNNNSVTAEWVWPYEVIGTNDNDYFSSWSLAGISYSHGGAASLATRRNISVTLTVSAGTATVTLGSLASGSGAVGGSVTLTELNSSGVSGSVTVDALAATSTGSLSVRWPRSMTILRDQTSPPSTSLTSVLFNSADTGSYVDTDVDVGTYYYAFRALSDTDDIGDQSSPQTVTVTGSPDAPDNLEYASGNAAATTVSWDASATVGATYNIYKQDPDDSFFDVTTTAATAIAGATSAVLPAISGYPGYANVLVRAVFGGIEELNYNVLRLEYDASGVIVLPRPNIPQIVSITVSSGLTAAHKITYNTFGENVSGTDVNIYARTAEGSYDFGTPTATGTLVTDNAGFKTATISHTFASDGWYYVTAKAESAAGQESAGYAAEIALYVSDENVTAPSGTFTASRG